MFLMPIAASRHSFWRDTNVAVSSGVGKGAHREGSGIVAWKSEAGSCNFRQTLQLL